MWRIEAGSTPLIARDVKAVANELGIPMFL